MKYMTIGNSGIRASVISLGALSIGGGDWWKSTVDETSIQTVHKALDLGVNLIDTAPIYGIGHSEEIIGKALEGRRHEAVISTKATFDWDTGVGRYAYDVDGHKMYCDHSYAGIIKDCENSLRRLKTDYIDIYYTHNPARDETMYPVEETVRALMDLKKAGKIRAIGSSNVQPEHIRKYQACGCEIDIIQRRYSMLDRVVEDTILPICREQGMTLHAYSPIEKGLLTGRFTKDYQLEPGEGRSTNKWWLGARFPLAIDFVNSLEDIRAKYDCQFSDLAVAFLRGQGDFINVICGARRPEQIEADTVGAELALSPEDLAEIRRRLVKLDEAVAAAEATAANN